MKKITVEIEWLGLTNYDEEDIRLALVHKFKTTNFSVRKINKESAVIINFPDDIPDNSSTTFTTDYKNIH